MKKFKIMLLLLILAIVASGCGGHTDKFEDHGTAADASDSTEKNELFTDEFFSNVVEIRDSRIGVISGEQMNAVIQYLKGLHLTKSDANLCTVNENGEKLSGLDVITFQKDGSEGITFLRNHSKLTCVSGDSVYSYAVEGHGNLNTGLKSAICQPVH